MQAELSLPDAPAQISMQTVLAYLQQNIHLWQQAPETLGKLLVYLSGVSFPAPSPPATRRILLPQGHGFRLVEETSIRFLEADGSYTRVNLTDGSQLLVSRTLKEFSELLNPHCFVRIHKSYLINLNHVEQFSRLQGGSVTLSDGTELLVSRRRLAFFLEKLSQASNCFS